MIYNFERDAESGVIFVIVKLDGDYKLKMVLDTAASTTTVDITALKIADYPIDKKIGTAKVETANGIFEVEVIEVESLTALGCTLHNMPVQVYDFVAHGIISDYNGLLGIDFFENTELYINLKNQTIEVKI
jgi:predicted aspartyl protease